MMRHPVLAAALASLTACGPGPVEEACLDSARGGDPALCSCVQEAADNTLTGGDQGRAAEFFYEPHRAQVIRQSDTARDDRFWSRYTRFGEVAEALCD